METILGELWLAPSLEVFCQRIEQLACKVTGAPGARYFSYHAQSNRLNRIDYDLGAEASFEASESTLEGWCVVHREPAWRQAGKAEPPGAPAGGVQLAPALVHPVMFFGCPQGVLRVEGLEPTGHLRDQVSEVCRYVGFAQSHIRSQQASRNFAQASLDWLGGALEHLYPGQKGHSERVSRVAVEVAGFLDLPPRSRDLLSLAGTVHDIGRLPLGGSSAEASRQAHARVGADFLRRDEAFSQVADWVENHHERWDGSGFPRGQGVSQDLALEAWVLSLAEGFTEALERGISAEQEALRFFREEGPKHHPVALDALAGWVDSGRWRQVYP